MKQYIRSSFGVYDWPSESEYNAYGKQLSKYLSRLKGGYFQKLKVVDWPPFEEMGSVITVQAISKDGEVYEHDVDAVELELSLDQVKTDAQYIVDSLIDLMDLDDHSDYELIQNKPSAETIVLARIHNKLPEAIKMYIPYFFEVREGRYSIDTTFDLQNKSLHVDFKNHTDRSRFAESYEFDLSDWYDTWIDVCKTSPMGLQTLDQSIYRCGYDIVEEMSKKF